jgi:hypothetical protein
MSCIVGAEKFYDFWFSADHCFLSKVIWFYESASFHCQCCLVFVWPGFRFVVTDRFRLATEQRVHRAWPCSAGLQIRRTATLRCNGC